MIDGLPSLTTINKKKYGALCSLLRGSSISANPEHLAPGVVEALNDLEREGICFLDKTGIPQADDVEPEKKDDAEAIDAGDAMGRYRLVAGKQGEAQAMVDQIDRAESQKRKRG